MEHSRLCVDLQALRANYRFIASAAPAAGAVVKANGYGLGAARVAQALREEGCREFFVATLAEGLALRQSSSSEGSIYVFSGPLDAAEASAMAAQGLTPCILATSGPSEQPFAACHGWWRWHDVPSCTRCVCDLV